MWDRGIEGTVRDTSSASYCAGAPGRIQERQGPVELGYWLGAYPGNLASGSQKLLCLRNELDSWMGILDHPGRPESQAQSQKAQVGIPCVVPHFSANWGTN